MYQVFVCVYRFLLMYFNNNKSDGFGIMYGNTTSPNMDDVLGHQTQDLEIFFF